jgi:hypothetical protein
MANTLQFLFDFSQINATAHKTGNIGNGGSIHFSFVKTYDELLLFRSQGAWLLDIGIFKFEFGVVSVEGLIQVVHSFQSHVLLDLVNHKYIFRFNTGQPFQIFCFMAAVLKKALNWCQSKEYLNYQAHVL